MEIFIHDFTRLRYPQTDNLTCARSENPFEWHLLSGIGSAQQTDGKLSERHPF